MDSSVLNSHLDFLIKLAWIIFYAVLVVVLGFTVVGSIAFWKTSKGSAKSFSLLFERAQALRICAVVLIIVSTLLLGVIGKIESSGLIAIFSGIAGYVLGGINKIPEPPKNGTSNHEVEI